MAIEPTQAPIVEERAVSGRSSVLTRFRDAYRGRHDADDALFWLDHPDQAGPSGAPPPGAAADALRREVYGPESTPVAAGRLADLLARDERDRTETRRALSVALAEPVQADTTSESGDAGTATADAYVVRGRTFRRSIRRALMALGCLAAGLGVGAVVGLLEPGAGDGVAAGAAAVVVATADPSIALQPSGAPPSGMLLNPQVVPDSVHRLRAGAQDRPALYAARNRLGDVCLLAGRAFVAAACVSPGDFDRSGVTLQWTTDAAGPRRVATWRPDGSVTLRVDS